MHAQITNDSTVYYINDTLKENGITIDKLENWLDKHASDKKTPDYIWDIVNAVAKGGEDF